MYHIFTYERIICHLNNCFWLEFCAAAVGKYLFLLTIMMVIIFSAITQLYTIMLTVGMDMVYIVSFSWDPFCTTRQGPFNIQQN